MAGITRFHCLLYNDVNKTNLHPPTCRTKSQNLMLYRLYSGWFLAVQIIMTLVLILTLVTTLMTLLFMIDCCPDRRAATTQLTNSLLMFGVGLLIAISVIIFGVQSDTDRQWLTRPDQNFLSWSFGLVVLAGFFAIFAGMCLLVDSLRIKAQARKENKEPMGGYIMKRAPPNY
ncbi:hypothetical protein CHS0354_037072 [Potamilus streckersoni]|uniref:Uncharacterized protein n=1 Tax=Potamilus streckersoni TaxID=2493646 RepID=A0AAE0W109_9BIVA|nr:hypothetical protein CHS0354_037072 [Potamilus streckersoni]